jgi:hypothetical protein
MRVPLRPRDKLLGAAAVAALTFGLMFAAFDNTSHRAAPTPLTGWTPTQQPAQQRLNEHNALLDEQGVLVGINKCYAMKGDDVGYCIEILSYPDPAERRMRQASLEKAQQEYVAAFPATIAKLEREYIAARARGADQDWLVTLADELQDVRQKYAKALIDIQHPVRLSPPEQGIEK